MCNIDKPLGDSCWLTEKRETGTSPSRLIGKPGTNTMLMGEKPATASGGLRCSHRGRQAGASACQKRPPLIQSDQPPRLAEGQGSPTRRSNV